LVGPVLLLGLWLPVWGLAASLRRTVSLPRTVLLAGLFGAGLVLGFHAAVGDTTAWWSRVFEAFLGDGLQAAGAEQAEALAQVAGIMTGFVGAAFTLSVLGSLLLARAGLLDGCRCTLHWENLPGFVEEFPGIEVSGELFAIDGRRYTCAGGTAALDMLLWLIGQQHGHALATQVSELFIHSAIRQQQQPQRMDLRARTGVCHPRLLECIELMEANVEQPLTLCELAEVTGTSKRQLERLFRRYLHSSPGRYYLQLRLRAGRKLLEQTSLPIIEVACACGFSSAGHFSQRFRALFGQTPRQARAAP